MFHDLVRKPCGAGSRATCGLSRREQRVPEGGLEWLSTLRLLWRYCININCQHVNGHQATVSSVSKTGTSLYV